MFTDAKTSNLSNNVNFCYSIKKQKIKKKYLKTARKDYGMSCFCPEVRTLRLQDNIYFHNHAPCEIISLNAIFSIPPFKI